MVKLLKFNKPVEIKNQKHIYSKDKWQYYMIQALFVG